MDDLKAWLSGRIKKEEYKLVWATPANGRDNIEKNLSMYQRCLELAEKEMGKEE